MSDITVDYEPENICIPETYSLLEYTGMFV